MKGLCPFHDEHSPSFHVRPQVGLWHCFGCGEGGDVISFVQKIDGLPFSDAVEYLAGRVGIQLRYEEGGAPRPGDEPGRRQRLLEAHRAAAGYFAEQLATPGGATARAFLAERGFDRGAAEQFGVGYAPQGWDSLLRHLRGRGFTEAELVATGLLSQKAGGGVYDRFRGRLVWPIREVTGDTVGFGARKLFEEDQGPKYLNTPETALYKKSQVLYGIDLAKREIARAKQVVVVEATPTSWRCTCPGWGRRSRPAAPRSAPTMRASCAGSSGTPARAAASSSRPAPRSAARSSSRSTATRPGRRPRCGHSARTSRSPPRRSSRSSAAAWTRASCARPRGPTRSGRSWPDAPRCSSSSSARPSRRTTWRPPRAASARSGLPRRSWPGSGTRRCVPSTRACWRAGSAWTRPRCAARSRARVAPQARADPTIPPAPRAATTPVQGTPGGPARAPRRPRR